MALMIFCMDHIWRDAWLRAITTMLPVIMFTGIAIVPLYLYTDLTIQQLHKNELELLEKRQRFHKQSLRQ